MDYKRRHDVGPVTIDVSPTYISTDLLTPVTTPTRVTLPAIAKFDRSLTEESGKWGTITVTSVTSTRADVTHRRYGCGCFNFNTSHQGFKLTSLMLSRCRKNDQFLFPPEKGRIHERQVLLPFPQQDSNASHVSRLSMFPDPFGGISLTTSVTQLPDKEKILTSLKRALYCTTGYGDKYRAHQRVGKGCGSAVDTVQDRSLIKDRGSSPVEEGLAIEVDSLCVEAAASQEEEEVIKEEDSEKQPPPLTIMVSSKATQTDSKDLKLEFAKTYIVHCARLYPALPPPYPIMKPHYQVQVKCSSTDSNQQVDASTQTVPHVTALVKVKRPPPEPNVLFPPHLPPNIPSTAVHSRPLSVKDKPVACFQLDSPLTMRFQAQLKFNKKHGESSAVRIKKRTHYVTR